MTFDPNAELLVMVEAVREAARGVSEAYKNFSGVKVASKGINDFVTSADIDAELKIRKVLASARPNYGFICEESGVSVSQDTDNCYIVDPIDGTLNFIRGIPIFALSVGLETNGEIVAGVTYNPATNELFYASKGGGAFCNKNRIYASKKQSISECLLFYDLPNLGHEQYDTRLDSVSCVRASGARMRNIGSTALELAYTAAGCFDGGWMNDIKPWDMAAGIIILREAGGEIRGMSGEQNPLRTGAYICGNSFIYYQLSDLLKKNA